MSFLFIMLVLAPSSIVCVNKEGFVNRINDRSLGAFAITTDIFGNPRKDVAFCKSRNAICAINGCGECKCASNDTFISYQHGCMNKRNSDTFLKASDCMEYEIGSNSIPAATPLTFDGGICPVLVYPSNIDQSKLCNIEYMSSVSLLDGSRSNVNNPFKFQKTNNGMCLACIGCMILPGGHLYRLNINCSGEQGGRSEISSCFVVKTFGVHKVTLTTITDPVTTSRPTTKTKPVTKTTTTSSSSTTTATTTISTANRTASTTPTGQETTTAIRNITEGPDARTANPTTKFSTVRISSTVQTTVSTTNNAIHSEPSHQSQHSKDDNTTVVISGIASGVLVVILVISSIIWCQVRKKKRKPDDKQVMYTKNEGRDNKNFQEDATYDTVEYETGFKTHSAGGTENPSVMMNEIYDVGTTYTGIADEHARSSTASNVIQNEIYGEMIESDLYETTQHDSSETKVCENNIYYASSLQPSTQQQTPSSQPVQPNIPRSLQNPSHNQGNPQEDNAMYEAFKNRTVVENAIYE